MVCLYFRAEYKAERFTRVSYSLRLSASVPFLANSLLSITRLMAFVSPCFSSHVRYDRVVRKACNAWDAGLPRPVVLFAACSFSRRSTNRLCSKIGTSRNALVTPRQ
jgi:hypothetical protein